MHCLPCGCPCSPVYMTSTFTLAKHVLHAIADTVCMQTGSWFELKNGNAVFGVLKPDNPLWGIILGFFGVSGYPTAGVLALDILSALLVYCCFSYCMCVLTACQLSLHAACYTGFLFYRAIQSANKASERADKADGY